MVYWSSNKYRFVIAVQNLGYFPDAVLNLLTNYGAGFTVRETAGMDIHQLITHVSISQHCQLNLFSLAIEFV